MDIVDCQTFLDQSWNLMAQYISEALWGRMSMYSNDFDFQEALINHKVYSAWQFIEYTRKNIEIANYCRTIIEKIIKNMTVKTTRWQQDIFGDFVEDVIDGKKVRKVTVTTENLPNYEMSLAGEKINPWFLFDKLLRDFYQYCMNGFDSMAQIANAGLLANKGKEVDTVDFSRMASCFSKTTYKTVFPKTSAWFEQINASPEYRYLEAVNNRTKHTADISNKLSMGILGSSNNAKIGPFFRKGVQHQEKDLNNQLEASIEFMNQSYGEFLSAFCDEFVLDVFTENRIQEIGGVYQQHMKSEPGQDLAYAFLNVSTNFDSMPDEIYILLVQVIENDFYVHNCPFERILVRGQSEYEIVGRYIAEKSIGDDCLFMYRKYVKDKQTTGGACMFYEMKEDIVFYNWNPFFKVTAVSDDDAFLERTSLPI